MELTTNVEKLHDQTEDSHELELGVVTRLTTELTVTSDSQEQLSIMRSLYHVSPVFAKFDICHRIVSLESAIERLLNILAYHENPEFQVHAIYVLGSFARYGGTSLCEKICNIPLAIVRIVDAMAAQNHPDVQKLAAKALQLLASLGGGILCHKIASMECVRQGIEHVVVETSPDVQVLAVEFLALMALNVKHDSILCQKILRISRCVTLNLHALAKHDTPHLQMRAARALLCFIRHDGQYVCQEITNVEGATENLGLALGQSSNLEIRKLVTNAISMLAEIGGQDLCETLTKPPKLIEHLLAGLVENELQFYAVEALVSLADKGGQTMCHAISFAEGSIEAIGNAVAENQDATVQLVALRVAALLALNGGPDVCLKIGKTPQCIARIVDALGRPDFPCLQLHGAQAVLSLAGKGGEKTCHALVKVPGAMQTIVKTIVQTQNLEVQVLAAETLASLAQFGGKEMCQTICAALGSIRILVDRLITEDLYALHFPLAKALKFLVENGRQSICNEFARASTTIDKFGHAIDKSVNAEVQALATQTIGLIALHGGEDLCQIICKKPKMLTTLVDALTKQHLQLDAAEALKYLADKGGGKACCAIARVDNAIQMLGAVLGERRISEAQTWAAQVLASLASYGDPQLWDKMCKTPTCIRGLVGALGSQSTPNLQLYSARTLKCLAEKGGKITCCEITNEKATIQHLVDNLTSSKEPQIQDVAGSILAILAEQGGQNVCVSLTNDLRTVKSLIEALSKQELEVSAAKAIKSLATNGGKDVCQKIAGVHGARQALKSSAASSWNPKVQALAKLTLQLLDSSQSRLISSPKIFAVVKLKS